MNVPWQGKGGLGPSRGRQLPPARGLGAFLNLTQNPAWALAGAGAGTGSFLRGRTLAPARSELFPLLQGKVLGFAEPQRHAQGAWLCGLDCHRPRGK